MNNIVWIVTVSILSPTGLQQLQAPKVFTDASMANQYQDNINQDPIYKNINAFCFVEPAILVEN